jgi:uncharacterized protein
MEVESNITAEFIHAHLAKARSYTLVFLTRGRNPEPADEADGQNQQMSHLQYLFALKEKKYVSIFGPLTDDGNVRGILIFNSIEPSAVKTLMDADPHVKAGSLGYEIHPWFGIPGQTLSS